MDEEAAGEGEEEAVCDDGSEGVGDGLFAGGFDSHAGAKGADFEDVGASGLVG